MTSFEKNEELYCIFGAQIGKDTNFMRQWVRLHTITNRAHIKTVAAEYLETKWLDITTWTKEVKEGWKGDVLALFVLCVITRVHCFIHLKGHNYWTSLKEVPNTHLEYVQRCNIHLSNLGQGVFAEHLMRTTRVSYKLFSIDQPVELEEKNPVVIGTLTSEENETLDILLEQSHPPIEARASINTVPSVYIQPQCGKTNNAMIVELPCTKTQASTSHDNIVQMDTKYVDSDSTIDIDYQSGFPTETPQTDNADNTTINTTTGKNTVQIKSVSTEGNSMVKLEQTESTAHTLPLDKPVSEIKKEYGEQI